MDVLKRFPILWLTLANAVALAVLAFAPPVVQANAVDACNEGPGVKCRCHEGDVPWWPAGCYEHFGTQNECQDDESCGWH